MGSMFGPRRETLPEIMSGFYVGNRHHGFDKILGTIRGFWALLGLIGETWLLLPTQILETPELRNIPGCTSNEGLIGGT